VLPLDEGIHLMEPVGDEWAVTISVYGKPVRRGYIQFFDLHGNQVSRVYHPRVFKQVLAIRALKSMPGLRVKEIPLPSLLQKLPDYLAKEL